MKIPSFHNAQSTSAGDGGDGGGVVVGDSSGSEVTAAVESLANLLRPQIIYVVKSSSLLSFLFLEFRVIELHDRCDPELIEKLIDLVKRNKVAIKGDQSN